MKNVSTLKPSGKIGSPKTPGGISKSLLTPCRRIGLSRNWRKGGVSPFISPLAGSAEDKSEKTEITPKRESRKRKDRCGEKSTVEKSQTPLSKDEDDEESIVEVSAAKTDDIKTTPLRNIVSPRKKKSKTFLASRIITEDSYDGESPKTSNFTKDAPTIAENVQVSMEENIPRPRPEKDIATPVRIKSVTKASNIVIAREEDGAKNIELKENLGKCFESEDTKGNTISIMNNAVEKSIKKSPDKLTKGCVVVIQKKLYKKDLEFLKQKEIKKKNIGAISQTLFDSDSDDVPLSALNKKEDATKDELPKQDGFDDDDDFTETKKIKVKKLVDKTTSIGGLPSDLSNKKKSKQKKDMMMIEPKTAVEPVLNALDSKLIPSTQSSIDDDDFVIDNKRTILIKKSYSKVTKPQKAKSTGSITQRDIDDLRARIEIKKKLLLAKAVTPDTEELRDLIKKWQKGCQDALMELMELMKTKLPDKQNMDHGEILQTLKIPPALVGYDEDNDCFNTPTDENIILSKLNDA